MKEYQYVKIEITKQEKNKLRAYSLIQGTTFQKLIGSIVREYLSRLD